MQHKLWETNIKLQQIVTCVYYKFAARRDEELKAIRKHFVQYTIGRAVKRHLRRKGPDITERNINIIR